MEVRWQRHAGTQTRGTPAVMTAHLEQENR